MLNWAKKHVRHKHKDAAGEQQSSETEQSSEKKEGSGRKSSPEKKLASERKTPSFARRFASIRKLAADRKSPEKGSRGKSKSPEKGLRAESRSPGTARKLDESSEKIEPSRKESCVSESSSSVTQRHPSPDHRRSPRRQSLEGQEASLPSISSPTVCVSKETQPDLEQKPKEDADDAQKSQLIGRDSQADNQAGSAGGAGADEAQISAAQATPERCITPDSNESPKSDHSPESDLRSDPASRTVRETGSRILHDLVVRESEDFENTDSSAKSADADTVASEGKSSSKVDMIVSDERTCKNETGVVELSDSTSHQYMNNTTKEIMNGVHEERAISDTSERRSSEDLQTKGQVKEEEFAEPQQTDQRDTVLQLPVPLVANNENGVTQSSNITSVDNEDHSNNDQRSHIIHHLKKNGYMDDTNHLATGSDSLKDRDLELPSAEIIKGNEESSPTTSVSQKDITETPSLMTDLPKDDKELSDQGSDTKISEKESGSKVIDSTQETVSLVDTPKDTEVLLPQCINDTPEDMEEPALGGISKEKTIMVTDSEIENKSTPPPVISEETVLSSASGTLKDDEILPSVPPSEPPDDIDVPPPLPESEPPEESEEPSMLPLNDGLTVTEKPPLPPKSDLLKYSVSKDVERPLPISPFSAFDEESEAANVADASGAQDDTEGKNQHIVPHASSSSNRKSVDLGGSEPYSLDSSHTVAEDKVQESLASSLNTSCDSDAAIVLVPPSPARRLSRESDVKDTMLIISQPSSMSASYDGSHKFTEHKPVSVSSGSSSAAVGGSLPSSPSVPHRSRRPHPVPAARSLQTLNTATPTKRTVTMMDKEEDRRDITKESPEPLREASHQEKHSEKLPREIPIPKPRKIMSLNPFESDEDEESESQDTIPKQVPVPKPRKSVSLNPFDSDDDESEIPKLEKSKVQAKQFPVPTLTTSAKVAVIGKNPFDEDDDEMEENSFSPVKNTTGESEFRPMRSSSPATHSLSSSHSSLSPRHLNDSLASISSQSSKIANESISTNPFDEDDDYDDSREVHNGLIRETLSRKSFSVTSSSPLQRDIVRSSLPPSTRGRTGRKKRPAPLPPGFRPTGMSSSTRDQQLVPDIASSSRGGSTSSINQESQRRDSISSISSLTLSPKKAPPPRPPPPKVKSNFMSKC